jgi:hypothetical protein
MWSSHGSARTRPLRLLFRDFAGWEQKTAGTSCNLVCVHCTSQHVPPYVSMEMFCNPVTLLQGETRQQTEASDMQSRECHECVFGYTVIPLLCVMVMPSCITRFSADAWPMPCLAVVESITTCLNGTDTLPIRQADLHFVAKLNKASVMHCLHAFARGEQRFGK